MTSGGKLLGKNLGRVVLTLQFERDGKNWVGTCVELGTSTFSRSIERTQKKLHELIVLHLDALEEEEERERFFEEHGRAWY